MKTQYYTACSLDGFIATEDHSLEWLFALGDPAESSYPGFIQEVGALAMGRSTYEWILRNLALVGAAGATGEAAEADACPASAWPYEQPTWVFTNRSLAPVPGAAIEFVRGDVRPVHAAMVAAAGGKNVWLAGGGDLVGQFHDAGLLDEIIVQIGAVTLGSGRPLLPRRILSPELELTELRNLGSGFAELTYAVRRKS